MNTAYLSDMLNRIVDQAYDLLNDLKGMLRTRRPVAAVSDETGMRISVICNDGTAFEYVGKWIELPPIPGTPAAKEEDDD